MNFKEEFKEYIQNSYIKKLEVGETDGIVTKVKITTLEGDDLELVCSIYDGIKIQNYGTTFENMEQLLNQYSPLYVTKFFTDLCEKLQQNDEQIHD